MAGIKHAFSSTLADGSNAALVKPSNWNASHVIGDGTMVIDAASSVGTFTLGTSTFANMTIGGVDPYGDSATVFNTGAVDFSGVSFQNSSPLTGGPYVTFYHNSPSPAANDTLATFAVLGNNSGGGLVEYCDWLMTLVDPTTGSEDSQMNFNVMSSGVNTQFLQLNGQSFRANVIPNLTVNSVTATPAGGSTSAALKFGTANDFGIFFGSGAPAIAAAQGSLYLRTDGSSTSSRIYVNTLGTTAWTNLVSGA